MKKMLEGRVSLWEREIPKRMENKEKREKRIRKSEKERNLDFDNFLTKKEGEKQWQCGWEQHKATGVEL